MAEEEKQAENQEQDMGESLGVFLKNTREKQGLSLEKTSELTKLRPRYIQALEEDDFEVLPNKVVARGFLKIYADRLGLDVKAVLSHFDEKYPEKSIINKTPVKNQENKQKDLAKKNLVPTALSAAPLKSSNSHQTFLTFITKQYRHYFYYGIGVLVIIFLFMHLTSLFLKDMNRSPKMRVGSKEIHAVDQTPELLLQKKIGFGGVIVIARPLANTWMRVYVDGIVNFKGPVDKGMVKQFQAKDYIRVRVGNGKAVDLLVNGKHYGKMSQEEEPVDKRFYPLSEEEKVSGNETEYKDPNIINPDLFGWDNESTENAGPPEGEEPWEAKIKKAQEQKAAEKKKAEDQEKKKEDSGGWW